MPFCNAKAKAAKRAGIPHSLQAYSCCWFRWTSAFLAPFFVVFAFHVLSVFFLRLHISHFAFSGSVLIKCPACSTSPSIFSTFSSMWVLRQRSFEGRNGKKRQKKYPSQESGKVGRGGSRHRQPCRRRCIAVASAAAAATAAAAGFADAGAGVTHRRWLE